MEFSTEQKRAFNKYLSGENIFITGPGGTGKTALIKQIQRDAYLKGYDIQVCALTGCAAVLLECKAKTVHSWAGIGLGNGSIEHNVAKIKKNHYARSNWKSTDILVIDEVSMMSQKLFEMLNAIGKAVRRSSKPFGGIQVIFSGDFYQLPPVGDREQPETTKFCFESPFWKETFKYTNHIILFHIFRQSDKLYQNILNQIREGRLRRSSNDQLLSLVGREIEPNLRVKPTKLFPKRDQVDYINNIEMNKLTTPITEYMIKYNYDLEMTAGQRLVRNGYTREQIHNELLYLQGNLRCDSLIKLKVGAQVMCIVNIQLDSGDILCNGAQGIVTELSPQGLPIVTYKNGYKMTMDYHTWESETIPGIGVAQVPLILAWALTIHKSQGATLDVAEIDAGSGIFECGQTYVALSRVKSMEGLYLKSFDASRVRINRTVQEFYDTVEEQIYKYEQEHVHVQEEDPEQKETEIVEAIAMPVDTIPMATEIVVVRLDYNNNDNSNLN